MLSFIKFLTENVNSQYKIAYSIAKKAHASQKDLIGVPYINHVNAVISGVSHLGDEFKSVAALHDVIEDTSYTLEFLRRQGVSERVLQAVDAITKRPGESRLSYYARVKRDPIARAVKLVDIKHNSSEARLKNLPIEKAEELRKKYEKARQIIESSYLEDDEILEYRTCILEKAKSSLTTQPWASTPVKTQEQVEELFKQIEKYLVKAREEYSRLLRRSADKKEDKILVNVKTLESFIDKVINRKKDPKTITDILRGAILVSTKEDADRVVNNLRKFGRIQRYEYKEFGSDKKFGYHGSHHIDVEVGGIIAEIQVMTKKLWTYKKAAHDIYTELRSGLLAMSDEQIRKKLSQSKQLFFIGNQ